MRAEGLLNGISSHRFLDLNDLGHLPKRKKRGMTRNPGASLFCRAWLPLAYEAIGTRCVVSGIGSAAEAAMRAA